MEDELRASSPNERKNMSTAYAIFGLAVAIAITFVLTVRMWIEREEKVIGH